MHEAGEPLFSQRGFFKNIFWHNSQVLNDWMLLNPAVLARYWRPSPLKTQDAALSINLDFYPQRYIKAPGVRRYDARARISCGPAGKINFIENIITARLQA